MINTSFLNANLKKMVQKSLLIVSVKKHQKTCCLIFRHLFFKYIKLSKELIVNKFIVKQISFQDSITADAVEDLEFYFKIP